MNRTKKLTTFTASYSQASVIFPYILVAPAYFAKDSARRHDADRVGLWQRAKGAVVLHLDLSLLADGRRWCNRLDGFEAAIASATASPKRSDRSTSCIARATADQPARSDAALPNGAPLVNADRLCFRKANARC